MKTFSLRGIDDELTDALKNEVRRTGTSINKTILNLIRESMGLTQKKRTRPYHDLDELAGTWSEEDELLFKEKTRFFNKIDEEIWD